MVFDKIYFKWKRSLNTGRYKLDMILSENEIDNELVKYGDWYVSQSNSKVKLKIDHQKKIEALLFTRGAKLAEFDVSWKFIDIAKDEFKSKLEVCEKDYSGDMLILHFGDCYLGTVSLIRGKK